MPFAEANRRINGESGIPYNELVEVLQVINVDYKRRTNNKG